MVAQLRAIVGALRALHGASGMMGDEKHGAKKQKNETGRCEQRNNGRCPAQVDERTRTSMVERG